MELSLHPTLYLRIVFTSILDTVFLSRYNAKASTQTQVFNKLKRAAKGKGVSIEKTRQCCLNHLCNLLFTSDKHQRDLDSRRVK